LKVKEGFSDSAIHEKGPRSHGARKAVDLTATKAELLDLAKQRDKINALLAERGLKFRVDFETPVKEEATKDSGLRYNKKATGVHTHIQPIRP
jgi:hypothetical protein